MATDERTELDMSRPAVFLRGELREQRRPRIVGPAAPRYGHAGRAHTNEPAPLAEAVDIVPLTLSRCPDLDQLFAKTGGPFGAWGMHWREQLSCLVRARLRPADWRYRLRKHLMTARRAPGLVAYSDTNPIAFVDVGPRSDFPKFNRMRAATTAKDADSDRIWAIPSLYVSARYRGFGVSNNLIDAACRFAHRSGATAIDAAPWDTKADAIGDAGTAGLVADFARQGFIEIARRVTKRPLMRKHFSRIIRELPRARRSLSRS